MIWLASQLWPAALISFVLGFVITWFTVVKPAEKVMAPRVAAGGASSGRRFGRRRDDDDVIDEPALDDDEVDGDATVVDGEADGSLQRSGLRDDVSFDHDNDARVERSPRVVATEPVVEENARGPQRRVGHSLGVASRDREELATDRRGSSVVAEQDDLVDDLTSDDCTPVMEPVSRSAEHDDFASAVADDDLASVEPAPSPADEAPRPVPSADSVDQPLDQDSASVDADAAEVRRADRSPAPEPRDESREQSTRVGGASRPTAKSIDIDDFVPPILPGAMWRGADRSEADVERSVTDTVTREPEPVPALDEGERVDAEHESAPTSRTGSHAAEHPEQRSETRAAGVGHAFAPRIEE